MILGLEWLKANKIVVDMAEHSVMAKDSGLILLNSAALLATCPHVCSSPPMTGTKVNQHVTPGNRSDVRFPVNPSHIKGSTCNAVKNCWLLSVRTWAQKALVLLELKRKVHQFPHQRSAILSFAMLRNHISSLVAQLSRTHDYQAAEQQLKSKFKDILIDAYPTTATVPSNKLVQQDLDIKAEFKDLFPEHLPHVDTLPSDIQHCKIVTAAEKICNSREYTRLCKWCEEWKKQIDEHLQAGRMRPSSSPFALPSFLVPNSDPSSSPRWVIDYRRLNSVTIPDHFPLPRIDDILSDCLRGKIWGKINMTSTFFQTKMDPDDIKYTACQTPFGLYKWIVMLMGLWNSPSTQQRRVTNALRHLIGHICHVYLDDIIIWSNSFAEHVRNVRLVLEALRTAKLFCSLKKSQLFCNEVLFLGHKISRNGIEADPAKVEHILSWPIPHSATEVWQFLGLVKFVAHFLPALAQHSQVLYALTTKAADKSFPSWSLKHQAAFEAVKQLVVSRQCLTSINHDKPGINKVFLTCNASISGTGAVLSWGPNWKESQPVAFDSQHYSGAQWHYPTHEQELLAIIHAL
jgi:hypothetical protein